MTGATGPPKQRKAKRAGSNSEAIMKILLIGSGGREHALAWALTKSPRCTGAFHCARESRDGQARHQCACSTSRIMPPSSQFCRTMGIGFVVVGPEAPLVAGIVDDLCGCGHHGFRAEPGRRAARGIEGLHEGFVPRSWHPDGRFCAVHARRARPRPMSARRARRSSSRPTGSRPARASSSPTSIEEALQPPST